jgi:hypothetical protein
MRTEEGGLRGGEGNRVERFEDLIAWQKARELTREIYSITGQGDFAKDFGLMGQIQRAAVSVMSNIAEYCVPQLRGRKVDSSIRYAAISAPLLWCGVLRVSSVGDEESFINSCRQPRHPVQKSVPSFTLLLISATLTSQPSRNSWPRRKRLPGSSVACVLLLPVNETPRESNLNLSPQSSALSPFL